MTETLISLSPAHFFLSLLIGAILAASFQMALTHLSLAAGMGAAESILESARQKSSISIKTFTTAYGLWTLATAGISSFAACWLAVRFSMTTSALVGTVLGLGIWGLFYLAMTLLQMRSVSSLAGSVFSVAGAGLDALKIPELSMFFRSERENQVEIEKKIKTSVREEFFDGKDAEDVKDELKKFIQVLRPRPVDPQMIREELLKLFSRSEIQVMSTYDRKLDHEKLTSALDFKYGRQRRAPAAAERKEQAVSKPQAENGVDSKLLQAGFSQEDVEKIRKEWENYLMNANRKLLDAEDIKRELETLLKDPAVIKEALKTRAAEIFNKSSILSLLSQRKDLSKEETDRALDSIDKVIRDIREKWKGSDMARVGALFKVREHLDSLEVPELKYEGLKDRLKEFFSDSKDNFDVLSQRFGSLDKETLKGFLAARKDIPPQDTEYIIQQVENIRDRTILKAKKMKEEVERRRLEAQSQAADESKKMREAAKDIAWWAFASAFGSGAAAVTGSLLGTL